MPFSENDDLVQAFFSYAAHPAFRVGAEIGRPRRQFNDLGPTSLGASVEFLTELAIPVVQGKPRQVVLLNREIAHLLNHPLCLRMLGHVEQQETIGTIELQLNSSKPNKSIIREALTSANTIAENAAGSLIASGVIAAINHVLMTL